MVGELQTSILGFVNKLVIISALILYILLFPFQLIT